MTEQDRKRDAAAFAAALRPLVASAALDEMENPNDAGEELFDRACERTPLAYGDAVAMVQELRSAVEPPPHNRMADDTAREFIRCAGEAWGYRAGTEGIPDNPVEAWAKWVTGDAIAVLLPSPTDWMIDLFIASWEAGLARRKEASKPKEKSK